MRRLKILLADDHALMFEAIALALENEDDLEIVGCAETGSQVLLRERFPEVSTAVLSGIDSDETIDAALRAGANAFISKSVDPAALADALRRAAREPVAKAIGVAEKRVDPIVEATGLTEREVAVLQALAQGQSNKEIARTLWLAEQTVKFHLTNIYRKLDVRGRTEAVHWAYHHGLPEAPADVPALRA